MPPPDGPGWQRVVERPRRARRGPAPRDPRAAAGSDPGALRQIDGGAEQGHCAARRRASRRGGRAGEARAGTSARGPPKAAARRGRARPPRGRRRGRRRCRRASRAGVCDGREGAQRVEAPDAEPAARSGASTDAPKRRPRCAARRAAWGRAARRADVSGERRVGDRQQQQIVILRCRARRELDRARPPSRRRGRRARREPGRPATSPARAPAAADDPDRERWRRPATGRRGRNGARRAAPAEGLTALRYAIAGEPWRNAAAGSRARRQRPGAELYADDAAPHPPSS